MRLTATCITNTTIQSVTMSASSTNATSQGVIQMAKKLTAPKTKTKVLTRYKDKPVKQKPKAVKPGTPPETAIDQPITSLDALRPVAPVPPLSNQQASD